ncbi:MAG TPA: hypothetical protein VK886_01320 [Vicinamibacterales bacterium]|nr:hypothetical protein [Vicinamibacterales bacterium]
MPPVVTTRPMTRQERALLLAPPVKLFGWWTGVASAVLAFPLAFLVVAFSTMFLLPYAVVIRVAIAAGMIAAVAWYVGIQRKARREYARLAAGAEQEAAAGVVQSTIYTITDAVAVAEAEDEGLSYYLLLDDGRTLFLSGQYLYDPTDNGFPWESFEIVHVASGSWVLRVVPRGRPIAPSWTRGPFSDAECARGGVPDDGTIQTRDFEALKGPAVRGGA